MTEQRHRDGYTKFTHSPVGKQVSNLLGLPQPTPLRRFTPGQPLLASDAPVLVAGTSAAAEHTAKTLYELGLDVRRDPGLKEPFAAIIVALDEAEKPGDIADPVLAAGNALKRLEKNGRVVVISREPDQDNLAGDSPEVAATRAGIEGLTRSIAHELRYGSTANGLVLADAVPVNAPSVTAALLFLLSARSAYVSGQFLHVGADAGELPADPNQPVAGKVIVVTGAARGIGAAISQVLSRDGAQVVGIDLPSGGEALAKTMNEVGGVSLQMDITAEDAGERIIEFCKERFGRLDGFVHNAGITQDKLLANMPASRWNSVVAVNLEAPLRINEALLAARTSEDGVVAKDLRIVSLASTSGIAGNRGQTNYATTKAGVMGMTAATADTLAATGGSINAVAPGFIETEMTDAMPTVPRELGRRVNSLSQGGLPVDVAEAIGFFLSDQAAGINGTTLRVCGQAIMGA